MNFQKLLDRIYKDEDNTLEKTIIKHDQSSSKYNYLEQSKIINEKKILHFDRSNT